VAREVEVALPVELTADQQRELVLGFVRSQLVDAGMVADIAIHHADGDNPHAHILLTMRDIGPDGFGKNRAWNDKQLLEIWREQWAEHTNRALEKAGHACVSIIEPLRPRASTESRKSTSARRCRRWRGAASKPK